MMSFNDKISLMIPAYLRGELSEEDRQQVEKLAAENPDIAADIEFQRNIKLALSKDENTYEPGDLGWAKLSKAMQSVSGVIIDGPSSLGLYQVEFASKSDCLNAAERFQTQRDIIETVSACD